MAPQVSIIGAGAVGLAMAEAFKRAAVPVEVVVRPERAKALRERGLWVKREGRSVAPIDVPIVSAADPASQILILTTKTYALAAAAAEHCAGRGPETTVIAVQNGLAPERVVRERAPRVNVLGGVATFTVTSLKRGEVEILAPENQRLNLALGAEDPGENRKIRQHPAWPILARAFALRPVKSLEGARWTKLLVNLNNGLLAATGQTARRFFAHPHGAWLAVAAMREGLHVCRAAKVKLAPIPKVSPGLFTLLGFLPMGFAAGIFKRRVAETFSPELEVYGSTLQSLKRKEPTEIDALNGAIVRFGESMGVATPVNAAITRAVQAQGRGEAPVSVEALIAEVSGERVSGVPARG